MIDLFFQHLNEFVLVRIDGHKILFGNTNYKGQLASIDGLKLNHNGVINEFPDLIGNNSWRDIAIQRFKDKIKDMSNEEEIAIYVIDDLKKHNYIPKLKQKKGFRIEKIK